MTTRELVETWSNDGIGEIQNPRQSAPRRPGIERVLSGLQAAGADRIKAPGANYKGDGQVARKFDAPPGDRCVRARARRVITLMRHVVGNRVIPVSPQGDPLDRLFSDSCASLRNRSVLDNDNLCLAPAREERDRRSSGPRRAAAYRDHRGRAGTTNHPAPIHLDI